MLPKYTVEKKGFQTLLRTFDVQYQLQSRKYFSNTATPALYASTREKVSDSISVTKHYAATANLWSSVTTAPYMSYTVHFIEQEWNLQSWCLQTLLFHRIMMLTTLLMLWWKPLTIGGNQVCLTTDNGSNIVCATSEHLNWNRLSCFGQNLRITLILCLM